MKQALKYVKLNIWFVMSVARILIPKLFLVITMSLSLFIFDKFQIDWQKAVLILNGDFSAEGREFKSRSEITILV